jgi:hypothetical protein
MAMDLGPGPFVKSSFNLRCVVNAVLSALADADGGDSGLQIELKGNLAAMLSAAQKATRSPETGDLELQIALVAGGGFEPPTFGL